MNRKYGISEAFDKETGFIVEDDYGTRSFLSTAEMIDYLKQVEAKDDPNYPVDLKIICKEVAYSIKPEYEDEIQAMTTEERVRCFDDWNLDSYIVQVFEQQLEV
ncbi:MULTISPECIES: hypothetical protein [Aerococcus]|uniref:hypothetical protein n=1 Tax=Aerococcus TaxID=1375 RepID=UPI0018A722FC|nr:MULTISPECIES: hypothetical protein [Aerococcus]MCY3067638.1 hypothetical protein [Aerococcus mictus]MCY3080460.1 hypothetical protein [Aerococcus mictus]MDK8484523.1 hypothetical protein [Aerococcus urinae]